MSSLDDYDQYLHYAMPFGDKSPLNRISFY